MSTKSFLAGFLSCLIAVSLYFWYGSFSNRSRELSKSARQDWRWAVEFDKLSKFCINLISSGKAGPNPGNLLNNSEDGDWAIFIDPDTQFKYSWIIFSAPFEYTKTQDYQRYPIAAAPRWGPERTKGQFFRMVGFSDKKVEWIPEERYVEMVKSFSVAFAQ